MAWLSSATVSTREPGRDARCEESARRGPRAGVSGAECSTNIGTLEPVPHHPAVYQYWSYTYAKYPARLRAALRWSDATFSRPGLSMTAWPVRSGRGTPGVVAQTATTCAS